MKNLLLGVLLGILLPVVVGYLFICLGGFPVATKSAPLPFEKFLARAAQHAAFRRFEGVASPLPNSGSNLLAGARIYEMQCAVCHGQLGRAPSAIAQGMFPAPPQLLPPKKGVSDDPVGETFWKVKNGIRLTGMPGYGDSFTDAELWQVSLLLADSNRLPEAILNFLRAAAVDGK